jgi:transcriptional regulator with XRE-family HTH domain
MDEIALGARLRTLRRWRGMTQTELAGLAGLSPSFVSMVEHGQRLLDRRSHIAALASWNVVDFDHIVDTPAGPQRGQEFPRRSALLTSRVKMLTAREMLGERPWETHLTTLTAALPDFARPPASAEVMTTQDHPSVVCMV